MEPTNIITVVLLTILVAVAVAGIRSYDKWMNKRMDLLDKVIERQELENQVYRNAHPGPRMLKDD